MLYLRLRLFPWSITCLKSMNTLRPEIEEDMEHNLISTSTKRCFGPGLVEQGQRGPKDVASPHKF